MSGIFQGCAAINTGGKRQEALVCERYHRNMLHVCVRAGVCVCVSEWAGVCRCTHNVGMKESPAVLFIQRRRVRKMQMQMKNLLRSVMLHQCRTFFNVSTITLELAWVFFFKKRMTDKLLRGKK